LADDPAKSGIYHFSGTPDVSWHGFATEIFARSARKIMLTPISTRAYPAPATRPLNSRMDCRLTEEIFGLPRPDWRVALNDILKELETLQ
jgi:dTDP-4-dehydrorhamnose reductase